MFGEGLRTKQTSGFGQGLLIAALAHRDLCGSFTLKNAYLTMADFIQALDPSKLVFFGAVCPAACRVTSMGYDTSTRFCLRSSRPLALLPTTCLFSCLEP